MTHSSARKILLVEDDATLQASLESVLRLSDYAVSLFVSAEDLLSALSEQPNDGTALCVLMDVHLAGMSGVDALQHLRQMAAPIPVVFMSGEHSAQVVNAAWRGGAHSFLLKPFRTRELLAALDEAFADVPDLPQVRRPVTISDEDARLTSQISLLTQRQREVLKWVAAGLSNTVISQKMAISARTVKMHRAGIMQRLGLGHVADLVRFHERCQHLLDPIEGPKFDQHNESF